VGINHCSTHRKAPWWVLTTVRHIGRHPGGYISPLYIQGGTLVVYTLVHTGRHPGGYIHQYTPREAPWWVYTTITPRRHPGGYMPHCYTLGRHPGGYMPLEPLRTLRERLKTLMSVLAPRGGSREPPYSRFTVGGRADHAENSG